MKLTLRCVLTSLSLVLVTTAAQPPARPALVVVIVIDGLRPDSITPEVMPHLDRLKRSGVWYNHSHSVFPTVTRVNAASISTGTLPSRHGIVSNALYLPTISGKLLNDGDYRNLESLATLNNGRVVSPKTLGEYFQDAGIRYVAVSAGSTGNALLLNPEAPKGIGVLVNAGFENGARVAFPDAVSSAILSRFGPVKGDSGDLSLVWTERVLREYVLDNLHPQVIVDWTSQPDEAQHAHGIGSPEALASLKLVDQQIGLLEDKLRQLGLRENTDFIVTCDHGFDYEPASDVLSALRDAGLPAEDVVVDNEGGGSLLYVKDHDPETIRKIAEKFQASETTNAIFLASERPDHGTFRCVPGKTKGWVAGTFALELANDCLPSHGPDIIVTYHWDTTQNPFGVPGTQLVPGRPNSTPQAAHHGHGGLNPYVVHSTLLLAGKDFRSGTMVDLPAGNQDIAPTVLAIEGLAGTGRMEGRTLVEALANPSKATAYRPVTTRIKTVRGSYCAEVEISRLGDHSYLNDARRCSASR